VLQSFRGGIASCSSGSIGGRDEIAGLQGLLRRCGISLFAFDAYGAISFGVLLVTIVFLRASVDSSSFPAIQMPPSTYYADDTEEVGAWKRLERQVNA